MYDATSALIASQEAASNRVYVSEVRWKRRGYRFQWLDLFPADYETYLSRFPPDTFSSAAKLQENAQLLTGLDREGAEN